MLTIAFWSAAFGLLTATIEGSDAGDVPGAAVAFAALLAPPTFAVAAFTSRRRDAPMGVLAGMGLSLLAALAAVVVLGNVLTALIAGHAAAAVVTIATDERTDRLRRVVAAATVVVVVGVGFAFAPLPTAFIAPGLPYTAVGLADRASVDAPSASGDER